MMKSILKNDYKKLDLIGKASDLGAITKNDKDDAKVYEKKIGSISNADSSFAVFRSEKGQYLVEYPFSEHAIVVEGSVMITDMNTGLRQQYSIGEGWVVEKGQKVTFEVGEEGFTKVYWAF